MFRATKRVDVTVTANIGLFYWYGYHRVMFAISIVLKHNQCLIKIRYTFLQIKKYIYKFKKNCYVLLEFDNANVGPLVRSQKV